MRERGLFYVLVAVLLWGGPSFATQKSISGMEYSYPVSRLGEGHSFGNSYIYVTLDGKTDVQSDRRTPRYGLRESTNQHYYLYGWEVSLTTAGGGPLVPVLTTFAPAFQQSRLEQGSIAVDKKFLVPFENNYLRSAHYLLEAAGDDHQELFIHSRWLLPKGTRVERVEWKDHKYLVLNFPDRAQGIVWGSGEIASFATREVAGGEQRPGDSSAAGGSNASRVPEVELTATYSWTPKPGGRAYALSFAYSLDKGEGVRTTLLNTLFDLFSPGAGSWSSHIARVQELLKETHRTFDRYLASAQLWTPDAVINRGYQWAKVNQLRLQQVGRRGASFTNDPPSDITVGRDTVWYLMGSSYYAQTWSRKLLDLWFQWGLETSGKFVEYFAASREPIFRDDYGLNIADNTPLLLMAAHHYYSLTGDLGFLHSVYPSLLHSANYILDQRKVGTNNRFGLVWCTSTDTFVRGLPVWRNAIPGYNLCGAPTELNTECYRSLLLVAELAQAMGDEPNRLRLEDAAQDLRVAINAHLRSHTQANPFYYLHINTAGEPVDDVTGDLLFPVLCGISAPAISRSILKELFSDNFWASTADGAGGIRTVSSAQRGKWGYQARAKPPGSGPNWNYGLLGGVWPNLAMWAARAAAAQGMPDLSLKALRGTFLLSEREDPAIYHVVPGEFPGYCNGDDLVEQEMPLSPFLPGIYIWSSLESFLGITPHPSGLEVNPSLPTGWDWVGVSNLPYRGRPLTILAIREGKTLYTTVPLQTQWKQIQISGSLQEKFSFRPKGSIFWLVVPADHGYELFASAAEPASGKLIDSESRRVLVELSVPAGALVRKKFLLK